MARTTIIDVNLTHHDLVKAKNAKGEDISYYSKPVSYEGETYNLNYLPVDKEYTSNTTGSKYYVKGRSQNFSDGADVNIYKNEYTSASNSPWGGQKVSYRFSGSFTKVDGKTVESIEIVDNMDNNGVIQIKISRNPEYEPSRSNGDIESNFGEDSVRPTVAETTKVIDDDLPF